MATVTTLAAFPAQPGATYDYYGGSQLVIDAAGDLFTGRVVYSDITGARTSFVYELAHTAGGYAPTLLPLATFAGEITSLKIDAAGNLFGSSARVFPGDADMVFEIPRTGGGYAPLTVLANPGPGSTDNIALDAQGNIFGVVTPRYDSATRSYTDGFLFEVAKTSAGYAATPTML